MTRLDAFREWIVKARPGQVFTYYTGFLAVDRGHIVDFGGDNEPEFIASGDINDLAKMALYAFEAGRLHLFQRKIHDHEYEYIAMKRRQAGGSW